MTSPRYENFGKILDLARRMQSSAAGVGLADIEAEFGVSRRTAERMRDAIVRTYGDAEELWDDENNCKRWRIAPEPGGSGDPMQTDEIAALDVAVAVLRREGLDGHADSLAAAAAKARRLLPKKVLASREIDLEVLAISEGLALRPGPRPNISTPVIAALRRAIVGGNRIRFTYEARIRGDVTRREVEPYGFLYGQRPYLVARVSEAGEASFRLFSIAEISDVEDTRIGFIRLADFSLADYARQSFGAFHEAPYEVVWRFSAAAAEARAWQFHPTQSFEPQDDGALIVRFRAGGLREMCWHLFAWRGEVEILAPQALKDEMAEHLRLAARCLGGPTPRGAR